MEVLRGSTKIIAEFDDRVETAGLLQIKFKNPITNPIDGATRTEWQIADTCYHESWDWLMPIVHKCLETNFGEIKTPLEHTLLNATGIDKSIDVAYLRVVRFINWYNEQNK